MFPAIITVLLLTRLAATVADDVSCLRGFKSSVSDPETKLWSWTFSDVSTNNFLCRFQGVSCWNYEENRVLSLYLPSASLSGSIPSALRHCSSITSLDLSDNNFYGPIPASLCTWLPYLVVLDLSSNSLSGPIPPQLSTCIYLNKLDLSFNLLSGSIPPSLSFLPRLRSLDLSDNDLSGLFPAGLFKFGAASFSHNPSLCGHPISSECKHGATKNINVIVNLAAGTIGFFLSIAICYILSRFCTSVGGGRMRKKKTVCCLDQVTSFSRSGYIRVSLFQDPVEEVMLADLTAATADFHPDNVVVAGNPDTGTSYKAILHDGSALTVKRLHGCSNSEREFREEMEALGQIRHPNLVPLLGFCFLEREKLLIYKNMSNGALSLRLRSGCESFGWPKRLRIALGVARGLAWLHHGFQTPLTHWNLNTSAVLLDVDDEPRIADFGLNRLFSTSTSSSTSEDVYQFGMLLLKLVTDGTAMENGDEEFADRVVRLSVAGWVGETIDPCLRGKGNEDEIVELLTIGCRCLVACAEERPSMFQVLKWLERIGGRVEFHEEFDEFPLLYDCE